MRRLISSLIPTALSLVVALSLASASGSQPLSGQQVTAGEMEFTRYSTPAGSIFVRPGVPDDLTRDMVEHLPRCVEAIASAYGVRITVDAYVFMVLQEVVLGQTRIIGGRWTYPAGLVPSAYYARTGDRHIVLFRGDWLVEATTYRRFSLLCHEVSHAFAWQVAGRGDLPAWLNEGLAMHFEKTVPGEEFALDSGAVRARRRITTLDALVRGEPRDLFRLTEIARGPDWNARLPNAGLNSLQYAQSFMMVQSLLGRSGLPAARDFLRHLAGGLPQDLAFRSAFGMPLDEFERAFVSEMRREADRQPPAMRVVVRLSPSGTTPDTRVIVWHSRPPELWITCTQRGATGEHAFQVAPTGDVRLLAGEPATCTIGPQRRALLSVEIFAPVFRGKLNVDGPGWALADYLYGYGVYTPTGRFYLYPREMEGVLPTRLERVPGAMHASFPDGNQIEVTEVR